MLELIVVVTIVVLLLAIAVPAISNMNAEARLTGARQTINAMTTHAYYRALADRTMTAVRFFPGSWAAIDDKTDLAPDRQHMAIYSYVGKNLREQPPGSGSFVYSAGEYFEPIADARIQQMPAGIWAAPLESLTVGAWGFTNYGAEVVLSGPLTSATEGFVFDAWQNSPGNFLNADDFLIICDPQAGVLAGQPQPFRISGYVPPQQHLAPNRRGFEHAGTDGVEEFRRYNSAGVVTYQREAFVALGLEADKGPARQEYLRRAGRSHIAQRFSGGLLPGAERPD